MTDSSNTTPVASRCPLCDADNQCAATAGKPIEQCWCYSASIPASALSRIPAVARGRQCICPQCGTPEGVNHER